MKERERKRRSVKNRAREEVFQSEKGGDEEEEVEGVRRW